jgi:hypothetical protein
MYCYLVSHLERPRIDDEAVLIWLPELSQAALNRLVWRVHLRLVLQGVSPASIDGVLSDRDEQGREGVILRRFFERAQAVERCLESDEPSLLGRALAFLEREPTSEAVRVPAALKVMPLGRFFQAGADIYSELLGGAIKNFGEKLMPR